MPKTDALSPEGGAGRGRLLWSLNPGRVGRGRLFRPHLTPPSPPPPRQVLRDYNCLQKLLQHLTSLSLTIVSNACGTLWNLSTRCAQDQELLWDLSAVGMLRNLVHSRHKMIAMGSATALRNLLAHRPAKHQAAATAVSPSTCVPSLYVCKQQAPEAELDAQHLAQALNHPEKQALPGARRQSRSRCRPCRTWTGWRGTTPPTRSASTTTTRRP